MNLQCADLPGLKRALVALTSACGQLSSGLLQDNALECVLFSHFHEWRKRVERMLIKLADDIPGQNGKYT